MAGLHRHVRYRRAQLHRLSRRCPTPAAWSSTASKVEELGYDSLWVWDHILLGVEPNFPIIDSLTLLTAIAARTSRIKLGTGILVLPLRNPVVLAKQLASMDQLSNGRLLMGMASGWYKREFDAVGVPFEQARQDHGREPRDPDAALDRRHGRRRVDGRTRSPQAVMYPKPVQSRARRS